MTAASDQLVNAVLSDVPIEPVLNETARLTDESITVTELLRWLILQADGPLREMTGQEQTCAMPLAAAHAAEGLQRLLGICAAGQDLTTTISISVPAELTAARQALRAAIATIDLVPTELATARAALSAAITTIDILSASDTPDQTRVT
jgi:hypothetical protein